MKKLIIITILFSLGMAQQNNFTPSQFQYNQSRFQAFYIFESGNIAGVSLSVGDWIGAFNEEVCVGSIPWTGVETTLPIMGDDDSQWTVGYMPAYGIPSFQVYDASENKYYHATPSQIYPFVDLDVQIIEDITVTFDCNFELGGFAVIDDCGVCSGGTSGHVFNLDLDCNGECAIDTPTSCEGENCGEAYVDGCGECVDGTTGNEACPIDCAGVEYGEAVWDDCGVCSGGTTDHEANSDMDCLGNCFGTAVEDECGVCAGDNSSCNQPIAESQNISILEDNVAQIELTGSDPNNDDLTFTIVSSPENGILLGNIPNIDYIPNDNFYGNDAILFTVSDGEWTSEVGVVSIEVESVNDLPVISEITTQNIDEDNFLTLVLSASDVDGDDVSFNVEVDNAQVDIDGQILTITPDSDFNGNLTVTVIAFDGSEESTTEFILGVNPINDSPVFSEISNQTTNEDEPLVLTLDVFDVDGDLLFFSGESIPEIGIEFVGSDVVLTTDENWYGSVDITLHVFDGEFTRSQSFTLDVIPVNDPPVIDSISDQVVNEDSELTISLSAFDVENDELTFSAVDGGTELIVDGNQLTMIPLPDYNGTVEITVSVFDGYLSDATTFNLNIFPVNDAPIIDAVSQQYVNEDNVFSYSFSAFDVEGDDLSYSVSGDETNASFIIANNTLTVYPNQNFNGDISYTVTVSDGEYADATMFTLTILPINDAPVIETIYNQEIEEDDVFTYTLSAFDVDLDELQFSATSSENATTSVNDNILTVTPDAEWSGIVTVTASVSDGEFSDTTTFELVVSPVNDAPILSDVAPQEISEDGVFSYELFVTDIDSESLYFNAVVDGNAIININENVITITPNENFYGLISVDAFVTDLFLSDEISFVLNVLPVNDSPELTFISNQIIDEDAILDISINATDIDSEDLLYTAELLSGFGTVEINGADVSFIPEAEWSGDAVINVSVSDGEFIIDQSFSVTVNAVNDSPIAMDVELNILEDSSGINFSFDVSDIDNSTDELMIFILNNPSLGNLEVSGLQATYTPFENKSGIEIIEYKVSDGNLSSNNGQLTIYIEAVNDAPEISNIANQVIEEDGQITFTVNALDIDGDDLVFTTNSEVVDVFTEGNEITIIPNENYFGSSEITVIVSDGQEIDETTFTLIVEPVNDAPILTAIEDVTFDEDSNFDFIAEVIDIDSDEIHLFLTGGFNITALINGNTIMFNSELNWNGSESFTLTASDGELTSTQEFNVTVNEVNDAPVAFDGYSETNEDNSVSFYLSGSDIDSENLVFNIESNAFYGTVDIINNTAVYTPNENYFGSDAFTFTVSDGEFFSSAEYIITIHPVNDAPITISTVDDIQVNEDADSIVLDLSLIFSDVEGDELLYLVSDDNPAVYTELENTLLSVRFVENAFGTGEMKLIASDGESSTSVSFNIEVLSVNDTPVLDEISDQSILEDEEFNYLLSAFDVDNSDLQFSATGEEVIVSMDDNLLNITPPLNFNGQVEITVSVTDGEDSSSQIFVLTVESVNDVPTVLNPVSDIIVNEDSEDVLIDLSTVFTDVESGSNLSLSFSENVASADISLDGSILTIDFIENLHGTGQVNLSASDLSSRLSVETQFNVIVNPVNDAPVAIATSATTNEDETIEIELFGDDIDGDNISFALETDAQNGSIVINESVAIYQPDDNFNGTDIFTFSVNDGEYSSAANVDISINPVNDAPELFVNSSFEINEDSQFNQEVTVSDIDNELSNLYISLSLSPSWLDVSGLNLVGTPTNSDVGVSYVQIYVSDGSLIATSNIEISVLDVNDPPVAQDQDVEINEDQSTTIFIFATDEDSEELTFEITSFPEFGELESSRAYATYNYIPDENYFGTDSFSFSVSDGEFSDNGVVTISINPVNDAPIASNEYIELNENESAPVYFLTEDVDDDNLDIIISSGPYHGELDGDVYTPDVNYSGSDIIVFQASDGDLLSNQAAVSFEVLNLNDPPVVANQSFNVLEESNINFTIVASDPEGDALEFELLSNPINGQLSGEFPNFTYSPVTNFFGEDSFDFKISDGDSFSEASITIYVENVNDAPINSDAMIFDVNASGHIFTLDGFYSDDDGDDLSIEFVPGYAGMGFGFYGGSIVPIGGGSFMYSTTMPYNIDMVMYKVKDGITESGLKMITFSIPGGREEPDRSAPMAIDQFVDVTEDQMMNVMLMGFDMFNPIPVDGSAYVTIEQQPEHGTILSTMIVSPYPGAMVQWLAMYMPHPNYSGPDSFTYTVYNPNNATAPLSSVGTITINVNAINDPPILMSINDQNFDEDSNISIPITFSDVDSDLDVSVSSTFGSHVSLSISNQSAYGANVNLDATNDFNGNGSVTVQVSEVGGTLSLSETFNVTVNAVNDAPSLVSLSDVLTSEGENVNISLNVIDIDGDTSFTYFVNVENTDMVSYSVSESILTLTPIEGQSGSTLISVVANDGEFDSNEVSFTLTIEASNDPPVLYLIADPFPVLEDSGSLIIETSYFDPDGDELEISIDVENSDLFSSVSFIGSTIELIPADNASGTSEIYVFVSDSEQTVAQTFTVTVTAVNDAPDLAPIDALELLEEETIQVVLEASDVDNSLFSYSVFSDVNINTSIDGNILSITGVQDFFGSVSLDVTVSDGELSDTQSVNIEILPVNDVPELAGISDVEFEEDGSTDITISANDVDGDNLTFEVIGGDNITASLDGSAISFSATSDWSGSESFTVIASDAELSDSQSFTVTVNAVNDAPVAFDTSAETNEDQTVTIFLTGEDADGDNLTYALETNASNGSVDINGAIATYVPDANYFGSDSFTFTAGDGEYSSSANVTITISGLNDAPELVDISDVEFDEDGSTDITISANDVDGDDLTFEVIGGNNITASLDGSAISFSAASDWSGSESFTVIASDAELSDSQSFTVTVNAVNDAPVAEEINIQVDEDNSIVIQLLGSDIDNQNSLLFSVLSDPLNGSLSEFDGSLITYTPTSDFFGEDVFTYEVSDGELSASATAVVSVQPLNDAPFITSFAPTNATEDIEYSYQVEVEDPDNTEFYYSLSNAPEGMEVSDSGLITWTPLEGVISSGTVILTVDDGGLSVDEVIDISVISVNDAPIISSSAPTTGTEDIVYLYQVIVEDPDNNSFEFSLLDAPEGMVITPSGVIAWTPTEGVLTSGLVTITVSDGDLEATQDFEVTVTPINDIPVITSVAPLDATEDIEYAYQVSVEDSDNDSFYYSLSNAPEGMEVSDSGLITWTPLEGILSSGNVTLIVSDGDLEITQEFEISVMIVNDVPVIISSAPSTAIEDIEYSYQVEVEDPDNDSFMFILYSAPEGMSITETGLVTWIATEGVLSSGIVEVFVSDGLLDTVEQFIITVTPVNDVPVIVSVAPDSMFVETMLDYVLEVEDPDDFTFTYSLENAPEGMFITESGHLRWFPEEVGTYGPITVLVYDDENAIGEQVFTLVVDYDYMVQQFDLHEGANLISFYSLPPQDVAVPYVFESIGDDISQLIGMQSLGFNLGSGQWVGSLDSISAEAGYWAILENEANLPIYGLPTESVEYIAVPGPNLFSYSYEESQYITDALPDEVLENTWAIFSENSAAVNVDGDFVGSLNTFKGGEGYWFIADISYVFEYGVPTGQALARANVLKDVPEEFSYNQSTLPSFYFIEEIETSSFNLDENDWIVAHCDNTIAGARNWSGNFTDVPVMGFDNRDATCGYCEAGQIPQFSILDDETGKIVNLSMNEAVAWRENNVTVVSLSEVAMPTEINLYDAYPNPFNPSTTISYDVPVDMNINISIYDLRGRLVKELVNAQMNASETPYQTTWNANNIASGTYFVKLTSESVIKTQKIMLIK